MWASPTSPRLPRLDKGGNAPQPAHAAHQLARGPVAAPAPPPLPRPRVHGHDSNRISSLSPGSSERFKLAQSDANASSLAIAVLVRHRVGAWVSARRVAAPGTRQVRRIGRCVGQRPRSKVRGFMPALRVGSVAFEKGTGAHCGALKSLRPLRRIPPTEGRCQVKRYPHLRFTATVGAPRRPRRRAPNMACVDAG
jgi:hypothetical protein